MKRKKNNTNTFINFFDRYPREKLLLAFFVVCFLYIIYSVFSYTVLNHDYYKKLADKQQLGKIIIPVNRWTIYASTTSSDTTLATSLSLDDLAIDPQVTWDKLKLWEYLTKIVYKEICEWKTIIECYNSLLKFVRVLEIPDFKFEETFIKEIISNEIINRINNTKVTSVLLYENLDEKNLEKVIMLWLPWIFFVWPNVYANPEEILNIEITAKELKTYLNLSFWELSNLLQKKEKRYIPILNRLSINISDEIEQYIKDESQAIKKWILERNNSIWWFIILTWNSSRYYPEKSLSASIVWFLDSAWVWQYWVEWFFNEQLRWNNWKIYARKDIMWRTIDSINFSNENLTTAWVDITLTIDRNIQKKVEQVIEEGVKQFKANKWSIVVMNPKTWNILAMANYPWFDLNSPADVYEIEKVNSINYPNPSIDLRWKIVLIEDQEKWEDFYYDGKKLKLKQASVEEIADPLLVKYKYKNDFWAWVYRNSIVSDLYEPWSIMKAITVAIWIDSWEINRYDMYQDNMEVVIDWFTIRNVWRECAWYQSFNNALIFSCNVWMIRIVQKIWKALLYNYQKAFWFGEPTNITLDWEVYSNLPNYEKRSKAQMYTMSYWLWISTTPLQMASAFSVLANWWVYVKPNIIKEIKTPTWKVLTYKPEKLHRVIKEETAKIITNMLVDSIENWFANKWKVEWYNMAGKTWTAEIAYKWWYEDWIWSTIWSFAWYGPAEDPKFVIITKLDRPRTTMFWWESSAYMFADISKYLLDYYWIPSKNIASNAK